MELCIEMNEMNRLVLHCVGVGSNLGPVRACSFYFHDLTALVKILQHLRVILYLTQQTLGGYSGKNTARERDRDGEIMLVRICLSVCVCVGVRMSEREIGRKFDMRVRERVMNE